jgi:hypothetical protein
MQVIADLKGNDEAGVDDPWSDFEGIAEVSPFICNLITPEE